jgi:hypothetical protein
MSGNRRDLVVQWCEVPGQGWAALPKGMRLALARQGIPSRQRQKSPTMKAAARICKKAGLMRRIVRLGTRRLVTLSWASDVPAFPDAFWSEIIPWIFDCWGPEWPEWEALLKRHRVRLAFFTARTSAEHFAKVVPGLKTHWLPEAQELGLLKPDKKLVERSIHVFEMGRKMQSVHDKIRDPLRAAGKKHLYDEPGKHASAVPPSLDALYQTMGDSAIVVCFPKSMTSPSGAGGVETLTQRYLETMGSRSLVVGSCPKELEDFFGFNPVVELSTTDPAAHMLEILGSLDSYQPLVDKAYARVREVGGFDVRSAEMLRLIDEFDRSGGR